jgi:hypothetical protein
MIYLIMTDQSYREVPEATNARIEGGELVCFNIAGAKIASFAAPTITAFGQHEALRDPNALAEPVGGGVRRERELSEAPLPAVRLP